MTVGADPVVVALLERILGELLELRAEVHALRSPPDERLGELLPAIRAAIGEDEFAAAWLVDAALDSVIGASELRGAIARIIGRRRPRGGVKRLGHFLARHAGAVAGDLRLERVRDSRDGAIFKVAHVTTAAAPGVTMRAPG